MNVKDSCLFGITIITFSLLAACRDDKPAATNQPIKVTPSPSAVQQDASTVSLDKSPMDMSYFPVDFPKQKMVKETGEMPVARVIYSRPKKDNRVIFGEVVKFGSPWRLGANEATEIEFFSNVSINRQQIKKGRYVLYCIPYPDRWKMVLNNDLYTWGLKIDSSKNAYSFEVPVKKVQGSFERFTMEFEKVDKGIELHIAWDTLYASIPIIY
jgi:hypothetical protein